MNSKTRFIGCEINALEKIWITCHAPANVVLDSGFAKERLAFVAQYIDDSLYLIDVHCFLEIPGETFVRLVQHLARKMLFRFFIGITPGDIECLNGSERLARSRSVIAHVNMFDLCRPDASNRALKSDLQLLEKAKLMFRY